MIKTEKKHFTFGKASLKKLEGVHPNLVKFANELLSISDFDFSITEDVRTVETQQEYYSYGRTKFINKWGAKVTSPITMCDGINHKSQHQIQKDGFGHAIDLAFVSNGPGNLDYSSVKYSYLRKLAQPLMLKYGIEWGGDWIKFKDMPRWQLKRS